MRKYFKTILLLEEDVKRGNDKKKAFHPVLTKGMFLWFILLFVYLNADLVFSKDFSSVIESRDMIFAVHFKDAKVGWIVGNKGLIAKTEDGGNTWERGEGITHHALYSIATIDSEVWVVGQKGTIFHSGDGGGRWEEQGSNTGASLMEVVFLDKTRGFVIGADSTLLTTEDGGKSWSPYPLDVASILPESLLERGVISINFYDLFFSDRTHGWIVGDNGIVLASFDGGKQWEVLRIGLFPPLFSVFFRDASRGFAVGQKGLLLHTEDGGRNWTQGETPTEENLYAICLDGDYGVIGGENGTLLKTKDGGINWEKIGLELRVPPPWFIDVCLFSNSPERVVVCVGENVVKKSSVK